MKKYRKKKRRPRRRYRKRPRKRRPKMSKINYLKLRHKTLVPDQLYTKLRFNDYLDLTNEQVPVRSFTFAMNGIHECLIGVGGQPLGKDQWGAFYQRYQVLASKISVTLLSGSGSGNTPRAEICVYPSNESTAVGFPSCKEQPYMRQRYLTGGQNNWMGKISQYITVRKLQGRVSEDNNYTGVLPEGVSNNPVTQLFWQVVMSTLNPQENLNHYLSFDIIYYVKLYQPKTLLTSS